MTTTDFDGLIQQLDAAGQTDLAGRLRSDDAPSRDALAGQLQSVDLELFAAQLQQLSDPILKKDDEPAADRARRATGPGQVVRLPDSESDHERRRKADDVGRQMLKDGRVGAILVAGGQGSRLGFEHPKGMYPVGPVSGHTLFQILCEQLLGRAREAGTAIPYFIMTSDVTHAETVDFFESNHYFGLDPEDVYFFQQGNMPAVDKDSHQILLSSDDRIQLSPDGHGGLLQALDRSGLFEVMRERGIDTLYYHQVDNPTASVCDPVFLGLHAESVAQISVKVVAKRTPTEKMGAVVDVDGVTQIIEYSDLPDELADARDADGAPVFWAGSTAIHVFDRDFLESLTQPDSALPFHIARKNVPYLGDDGELVTPTNADDPNAIKFERFIFDCLPEAGTTLVVEAARENEFNPVKNATGNDSPETSQSAILALHRTWLINAGCKVPDSCQVEISPLTAMNSDSLKGLSIPDFASDSKVFLDLKAT